LEEVNALQQDDNLTGAIMDTLRGRLGDRMAEYTIPPPCFTLMQGEFLEFDPIPGSLSAQFPVLESYLNPYGTMQGGLVSAAVDNTLGPLSALVAPPNVTRHLELTYSQPITLDMEHIVVRARLLERKGQQLFFKARVQNQEGLRLARAKAVHWILNES
jgi:acyl-coenzyme A thioesterase PaaI-like protein